MDNLDEELEESREALENDESFNELKLLKADMLKKAREIPYEIRRMDLEWTSMLDEDGHALEKKIVKSIAELSTKHLKSILKWTDYDFNTNYDLVLHTVNEEYVYRRKHY